MGKPGTIERECEICGRQFSARADHVRRGWGRYCSLQCNGAAMRLTPEQRLWPRVTKTESCWLWTGGASKGYGRIRGGIPAHRYSWEMHFGPIPAGLWVLHHCDTPLCVRPDHLFLGTAADNHADMISKGRGHSNKGIKYPPGLMKGRPKGVVSKRTPGVPLGRPVGNKLSAASLASFRRKRGWD